MADESNVNIIISGLMLFHFPVETKRCEVKIHTAVEGHVMKIKVTSSDDDRREIYSNEAQPFNKHQLKAIHPLTISVVAGDPLQPIGNSAEPGDGYEKILNLEDGVFYGHQLELKENSKERSYEASLFLNNGTIEGGEEALNCYRVKEEHFVNLNFREISRYVWDAFMTRAQQDDPESIREIEGFVKDVQVQITLQEGQSLRFTYGEVPTDIFPPLRHGRNYRIEITYEDHHLTQASLNLSECIGFAHHCRAFKLADEEPIFGLFNLQFTGLQGHSQPGCCLSCRVTPRP